MRSLQRMAGNRAVRRLLRDAAPAIEPVETALYFDDWSSGHRDALLTPELLAGWVAQHAGDGEDRLESQILASHTFRGSQAARRHWAAYLRGHRAQLAAMTDGRRAAEKSEVERERAAETLRAAEADVAEFTSERYEGEYQVANGRFHAAYDPGTATLTVSVPVQYEFVDSESGVVEILGAGTEHPQVKADPTILRWTGAESADYKRTLAALVETFWSRHQLRCTRPGWQNVTARVVVRVEETGDALRPGSLFPIKLRVYRGTTRSGGEFVRQGMAELGYADVTPLTPGANPWVLHEFGHLLGFDDEYNWGNANPASVMVNAGTGGVLVEHGRLFADALRAITGVAGWEASLR